MKEIIFNYLIKQPEPITFDQLMAAFPDCGGQKSFGTSLSNIIFWEGMSEDLTLALIELAEDKVVRLVPCSSDIIEVQH